MEDVPTYFFVNADVPDLAENLPPAKGNPKYTVRVYSGGLGLQNEYVSELGQGSKLLFRPGRNSIDDTVAAFEDAGFEVVRLK